MKNIAIIGVVSFVVFIVSCSSHNPINPFPAPTPCAAGNLSFSPFPYGTTLLNSGSNIITTQADYLSNYSYNANPFNVSPVPTPTPVPIDFNKKMLLGFSVYLACGLEAWELKGITTDCKTVTVDVSSTFNCAKCESSGYYVTYWYIVDKSNLPINVQFTNINECNKTTTTSTAPFNVSVTSGPISVTYTPGGRWLKGG